jgi:hypothetical protein
MRGDILKDLPTQSANPQVDIALLIVRRWSRFFDKAFRIPGTKMRFGWDPILGVIPGLGDAVTGILSLLLLIKAFQLRVPGIIRARMILNTIIDVASGTIPLVGDAFDFVWKSNSLNLSLLEKHAGSGIKSRSSDWFFVFGILAAALAILLVPLIVLAVFVEKLTTFFGVPLFNTMRIF